jgi:hypothetical protein
MENESKQESAPSARLREICAFHIAERAAVLKTLASYEAALAEAQSKVDALRAESNARLTALEEAAKKLADEESAAIFADSATFKHGDCVLRKSSGRGVQVEDEKAAVAALADEAFGDASRRAEKAAAEIRGLIASYQAMPSLTYALGGIADELLAPPSSDTMSAAACLSTEHKLNKRFVLSLYSLHRRWFDLRGLHVAKTSTIGFKVEKKEGGE